MSDLIDTYGHVRHRPLVMAIAKLGGLTTDEAGIADDTGRIDPLELVRQRAQRDMARVLVKRLGWDVGVLAPVAKAKRRQEMALGDGGGNDAS